MNEAAKRFLGQALDLATKIGGRAAASAVRSVVKDSKRATRVVQKRLEKAEKTLADMLMGQDDDVETEKNSDEPQ